MKIKFDKKPVILLNNCPVHVFFSEKIMQWNWKKNFNAIEKIYSAEEAILF